ncbi:MAG TPA: polysaccharide deacetylase family protein [Candidatus Saccharimonadales bacterium]|nr:polysaccharide deacetylase family protein [Candidatus Saccharimonadales bacterium]
MKKTQTKRIASWQENIRAASPFVILCGCVAVFYFLYRIVLIAYPVAIIEQNAFNPKHPEVVVCGQEEGSHLKDPAPVLSASYQKRIHDQAPLGSNLVPNPGLNDVDQETGQPVGYGHSIENDTSKYQYLQEADKPGSLFLRTTDTQKDSNAPTPPAWLTDFATVEPEHTYAYSFEYRSNTPVKVSIEYTKKDGKTGYIGVVTLKPAKTWQLFTAHFDNTADIASIRIDTNGTIPGIVDTRAFDIHRIKDAELSKGLVSVTFDDGWESVDSHALELLTKHHIRTTQYIISDVAAKSVPEYMNYDAVTRFKKAGHEIGSHSLTHCNQTKLDTASIKNNAIASKQTLEQQKLGPITSFAYPLGQYNEATQDIFSKHYQFIRTSDYGFNDRYFDETNVHSIGILDTTTDHELKMWLDFAKTHHQWVVFVYHRVNDSGEYNVTTQQLDRQLDLISQSGLQTLPLGEAGKQIRHN